MIVRELITRLGFTASNRAANKHETALRRVRHAAVAVTAAYAATVGAVASLSNAYASAARQIDNQRRLANASAQEFQRIAAGARKYGIEQEKVADILKDTNDRVGDFLATGGGEMADFFENVASKVGVTAEQFRGLSGPQALQLYVETLERANLSQQEMTFYMEAMANDSTALIPLLRNGGEEMRRMGDEAERSGAIMSERGMKAASEYRDSLRSLRNMTTGLRNTIAENFLPVLADTARGMAEWYRENRQLILQNLGRYMRSLAGSLRSIGDFIGDMVGAINKAVEVIGGWERSLRILGIMIGQIIAFKLAAWFFGAATAAGALRWALILIQRTAIVAGLFLIATAIEDLIFWINGGDSAIGEWIGSWEDFKKSAQDVAESVIEYIDPLISQFKAVGKIIKSFLYIDPDGVMEGFYELGGNILRWGATLGSSLVNAITGVMPDWMKNFFTADVRGGSALGGSNAQMVGDQMRSSSTNNRNVNVNATTQVMVPQGTSETQRKAIESQAQGIFEQLFNREINRSLNDMPVTE